MDPHYRSSLCGLSRILRADGWLHWVAANRVHPESARSGERALELDERLPEAHTALAVIAQNYDWDWATAEKEYRRAIQLNPNYATGHHWYAECLALQGRFNEAFPEIESARQLDPLSLIIAD